MIHDYAQDTAHVVAHASLYAVVKFTRRGQITRVEVNSLVQARAVAKRLYRGASPVGIYCVAFNLGGSNRAGGAPGELSAIEIPGLLPRHSPLAKPWSTASKRSARGTNN